MSRNDVFTNFAERKVNRLWGTVKWSDGNVFCDGAILYSYGRHFPLAVYLGNGPLGGGPLFIKNGDRYSSTTSGHQAATQSACPGPTASFSMLRQAGVDPTTLSRFALVDCVEDTWSSPLIRDGAGLWAREPWWHDEAPLEPFVATAGMFVPGTRWPGYDGRWHTLGGVLLNVQDRYLLAGLDGTSYYVTQLPRPATDMADAFRALRPAAVQAADAVGLAVLRQGEWFFTPTGLDACGLADALGLPVREVRRQTRQAALPQPDDGADPGQRNDHVARLLRLKGTLYATGTVYHRRRGRGTGEHPSLKLGQEYFVAERNTALRSWSAGGRFD